MFIAVVVFLCFLNVAAGNGYNGSSHVGC